MNSPLSDAEAEDLRLRLSLIAHRHLDRLARLPFLDRLTVVTTLLGCLLMEIDDGQQLAVLDDVANGLREHLNTIGGVA
jgi:hypothetical protein